MEPCATPNAAERVRAGRRLLGGAIAVLLLASAIRGGAIFALRDSLRADPDGYYAVAKNVQTHGVFGYDDVPTAYRPPLYPLLLTACVAVEPWDRGSVALIHLVFGVAAAYGTYRLAWRLTDRIGPAIAAGLLVAADPILLAQSPLVMTETTATALAVGAVLAAVRAVEVPTRRRALLAGVAAGLASLCRPTFLPWAAVVAPVLALLIPRSGRRIACSLAYAVGVAVMLLPWAARNQIQFGRPIFGTTHGGYTFLLANNPHFYRAMHADDEGRVWQAEELNRTLPWRMPFASPAEELAADRTAYDMARNAIREQPDEFARACVVRVGRLWGVLPHSLSPSESTGRRAARYAVGLWYGLELPLALLGCVGGGLSLVRGKRARSPERIASAPQSPPLASDPTARRSVWIFWLLMVACFTAIHTLYWTDMRMRAPLMPGVVLGAVAAGWTMLQGRWIRKSLDNKDL